MLQLQACCTLVGDARVTALLVWRLSVAAAWGSYKARPASLPCVSLHAAWTAFEANVSNREPSGNYAMLSLASNSKADPVALPTSNLALPGQEVQQTAWLVERMMVSCSGWSGLCMCCLCLYAFRPTPQGRHKSSCRLFTWSLLPALPCAQVETATLTVLANCSESYTVSDGCLRLALNGLPVHAPCTGAAFARHAGCPSSW